MDNSQHERWAKAFGGAAAVYERTRPDYPEDAVRWLVGTNPSKILELGAGTGKLTSTLLKQGHRVVASEPSKPMLRLLRTRIPTPPMIQASAEQIPLASSSVDLVLAGQAFQWFDAEKALPEIARVLRAAGVIGLLSNYRDESVPWVRRLGRLMGSREPQDHEADPAGTLEESGLFEGVEKKTFRHWQQIDRDGLLGLVSSRSYVIDMPEDRRQKLLAEVGELYDGYGRGRDGMVLPYRTDCYRGRVSGLANYRRDQDPPLDDGLLIDFT
ncbi:MAG: methyltransferase domain-containing protein [Propionibacteriales bacterium]|nr:methyltransferase domain-containing protein [Propionibacteriales bacterium]